MTVAAERAVLEAWGTAREAGHPGARSDRIRALATLLLGAGSADRPWDEASAAFLRLAGGGASPTALAPCETCGEVLELEVPVAALLAAHEGAVGTSALVPPGVGNMVEAAVLPPEDAERLLLTSTGVDALPAAEQADALAALEESHVLLAPTLAGPCGACGQTAEVALDVVAMAWAVVEQEARAAMAEVAALGRAYGWTEEEVLALPRRRRQHYRELADGGVW